MRGHLPIWHLIFWVKYSTVVVYHTENILFLSKPRFLLLTWRLLTIFHIFMRWKLPNYLKNTFHARFFIDLTLILCWHIYPFESTASAFFIITHHKKVNIYFFHIAAKGVCRSVEKAFRKKFRSCEQRHYNILKQLGTPTPTGYTMNVKKHSPKVA